MTDQSSVFNEQTPPTQAQEQQQPAPTQEGQPPQSGAPAAPQQPAAPSDTLFADQLASITNESGEPKYKDANTALEALKHSQQYIPQLKQQNETLSQEVERLKAELDQKANLEETIERLTSRRPDPASPEQTGLTEEQVRGLLEQSLSQREKDQLAVTNLQQVEQALVSQYSDKAPEIVQQKAKEWDMTLDQMKQLASENPKMVQALFNVKPSPQGKTTTTSSVNIPPVAPSGSPELQRPEKSLLSGASYKDQKAYLQEIRNKVYEKYGVTQ